MADSDVSSPDLHAVETVDGVEAPRPRVDVRGLARTFGRHEVFDGVDFSVASHEVHAIIGANGAGKSTMLRILAGVMAPTAGRARIMGHEPRDRAARQQVGWLPSTDRSFYLRLSGLENLVFFGRLHGLSLDAARERSTVLLGELGLAAAARQRAGEYSRGMLRRLSVARALLPDPAVLLLDEPTHDLDPEGVSTVKELVRSSDAAVVWATQQLSELDGFADNVLVLAGGGQRYDGPLAALVAGNRGTRHMLRLRTTDGRPVDVRDLDAVLGAAATVEEGGASDGQVVVELRSGQTVGAVIATLHRAGCDVVACRPEQGEVEQALLRLIRRLDDG